MFHANVGFLQSLLGNAHDHLWMRDRETSDAFSLYHLLHERKENHSHFKCPTMFIICIKNHQKHTINVDVLTEASEVCS